MNTESELPGIYLPIESCDDSQLSLVLDGWYPDAVSAENVTAMLLAACRNRGILSVRVGELPA